MNRFRTLNMLSIGAGTVLKLSVEQAVQRAHNLKDLGGGRYEALVVVQFKRGETIGIEGDLPKVHQHLVDALDNEKREPPTPKTAPPTSREAGKAVIGNAPRTAA